VACSGPLAVLGPEGHPVVVASADPRSHDGEIRTLAANGASLVQVGSTPGGGVVVAIGRSGRVSAIGELGQPPTEKKLDQKGGKGPQQKPPAENTGKQPASPASKAANRSADQRNPSPVKDAASPPK
jgi:hypothetical protein